MVMDESHDGTAPKRIIGNHRYEPPSKKEECISQKQKSNNRHPTVGDYCEHQSSDSPPSINIVHHPYPKNVIAIGPLPHLSCIHYEIDGVPIIPRPAIPPTLSCYPSGGKWEDSLEIITASRRKLMELGDGKTIETGSIPMREINTTIKKSKRSLCCDNTSTLEYDLTMDTGHDDREVVFRAQSDLDLQNKRLALWRNQILESQQHHSAEASNLYTDKNQKANMAAICILDPTVPTQSHRESSQLKNGVEGHWIEYWDKEVEATYYFNFITGEASWVNPEEESRSSNYEFKY